MHVAWSAELIIFEMVILKVCNGMRHIRFTGKTTSPAAIKLRLRRLSGIKAPPELIELPARGVASAPRRERRPPEPPCAPLPWLVVTSDTAINALRALLQTVR